MNLRTAQALVDSTWPRITNVEHFRRERAYQMRLARTCVTDVARSRHAYLARRANHYLIVEIGAARARDLMAAGEQLPAIAVRQAS
jgi:hypothetical protein